VSEPEALALIEFRSIALGTRAIDALIKKAAVLVERMGTLQPGKFAVLFSGDVASVDESFGEAMRVAGETVSDSMMLPMIEPRVYRAVMGQRGLFQGDTLGVLEADSMAAVIEGADSALKGALVEVVSLRLGDELGGKGVAHFVGEQHDVQEAMDLAVLRVKRDGRQVLSSVTPRADSELLMRLGQGTRFWGGQGGWS
jgi:microcompartment protein CcmL/EutN